MTLAPNRQSRWYLQEHLFHSRIPPRMACWLFDPASLTARLRAACAGQFRVEVVSQGWASPLVNEQDRLGMRARQVALLREVYLYCDAQPWVFARTVIPRTTLSGKRKYLANLGSRPLGAVLFADPGMRRDHFEVACLQPGEWLYQRAIARLPTAPERIWGRRSAFYLGGKPLLVNEIFLPAMAHCPTPGQED